MKPLLATLLLVLSTAANAGDWHVQVHGASLHLTPRNEVPWNETNDGFGIRYSWDSAWAVQAGHYRNDYTMPGFNFFTNYGVVDYTPIHRGEVHYGGFAGVESGHDDYTFKVMNGRPQVNVTKDGVISPVFGLMARWQGPVFNVGIRLTPQIANVPTALAIEGGFHF